MFLVSAANMTLKLGEPAQAVSMYKRAQLMELSPYLKGLVEKKLTEATEQMVSEASSCSTAFVQSLLEQCAGDVAGAAAKETRSESSAKPLGPPKDSTGGAPPDMTTALAVLQLSGDLTTAVVETILQVQRAVTA